jgi:multidrug efflux pump subunit AcrA (membrane-fusion protein)
MDAPIDRRRPQMGQPDPKITPFPNPGPPPKKFIVTVKLPVLARQIEVTGVNNPSEAVAVAMRGEGRELTSRYNGTIVYTVDEVTD